MKADSEPQASAQADMLNALHDETLMALIYQDGNEPLHIPCGFWQDQFADVVLATGEMYEMSIPKDRRQGLDGLPVVLRREQWNSWKTSHVNQKPTKTTPVIESDNSVERAAGRPSLKREIRTAFRTLRKSGRVDFTKALTSQTPMLRNQVRADNPNLTNNKGLGVETIRRAIRRVFDKGTELTKQKSVDSSKLSSKL